MNCELMEALYEHCRLKGAQRHVLLAVASLAAALVVTGAL